MALERKRVIVIVVHNVGVTAYKLEYDSGVTAHLDSPLSLLVAF